MLTCTVATGFDEESVVVDNIIAGLGALALLAYLVYALLLPERI